MPYSRRHDGTAAGRGGAFSRGIQDRVGTRALLVRLFMRLECLKTLFADGGYRGRLINWAPSMFS